VTRKLKRRLGVGCGVWGVGCGGVVMHPLVGMGEMREIGEMKRMGEMRRIGEMREKIYFNLPYLPHLVPPRRGGGWGGVKPPHQLTNSILLLS